ncbi:hypothetical protein KCP73_14665 [Salmonella enterica subsp. enterica]|nr:hypothetical protein KCP73_14665 [Salmonella enterica subsp. enterica]
MRPPAPPSPESTDRHRAGVVIHHRFHRMKIVEGNVNNIGGFRPKAVDLRRCPPTDGKQRRERRYGRQ